MKMKTVFLSDDGTQFGKESDCQKYETLCVEVASAMAAMKPRPDDMDFANGGGFIQQTAVEVDAARRLLAAAAVRFFSDGSNIAQWFNEWKEGTRHVSHVARMMDDSGERCLYAALIRFMCVDSMFREFGQPFYANNPSAAKLQEVSK